MKPRKTCWPSASKQAPEVSRFNEAAAVKPRKTVMAGGQYTVGGRKLQ